MSRLTRVDLVILDEPGYLPFPRSGGRCGVRRHAGVDLVAGDLDIAWAKQHYGTSMDYHRRTRIAQFQPSARQTTD